MKRSIVALALALGLGLGGRELLAQDAQAPSTSRAFFEYKVVPTVGDFEKTLNQLAEEGWEYRGHSDAVAVVERRRK